MNFIIIFHFEAILRSLIFDLIYWPLRLLGPNFFELWTLIFFSPNAFYTCQHVTTEFLSRSTNTFCPAPTLMCYRRRGMYICMSDTHRLDDGTAHSTGFFCNWTYGKVLPPTVSQSELFWGERGETSSAGLPAPITPVWTHIGGHEVVPAARTM